MTARRTKSRATAAMAALVGCALLLTGCGIKRSGVVDSGHAATVKVPGSKTAAILYFVSREGDRLVPVPFAISAEYTLAPVPLLRLLLNGPTGPADAAGLTTALPRLSDAQAEAVAVSQNSTDEGLTVRVPFAVGSLSDLGRDQLVCTVGASALPNTFSPVTLQGTDTTLPSAECDTGR